MAGGRGLIRASDPKHKFRHIGRQWGEGWLGARQGRGELAHSGVGEQPRAHPNNIAVRKAASNPDRGSKARMPEAGRKRRPRDGEYPPGEKKASSKKNHGEGGRRGALKA